MIPNLGTDWPQVKDCVLLVTDSKHPRYGQIAAIEAHDWKEMGVYHVRFPDGQRAELSDGWENADRQQGKTFYRGSDYKFMGSGPNLGGLKEEIKTRGISLEDTARDYKSLFGQDISLE